MSAEAALIIKIEDGGKLLDDIEAEEDINVQEVHIQSVTFLLLLHLDSKDV